MEDKKMRIDLHFILKQGRHLICGLIVAIFVLVYSFSAFAYADTIGGYFNAGDYEIIGNIYNLDSDTTYPVLTSSNVQTFNTDITFQNNISNGIWNYYTSTSPGGGASVADFNSFLKSDYVFPLSQTVIDSGVQFDFTNAYHFLNGLSYDGGAWNIYDIVTLGSSEIAVVDNYFVSDSPFYVFESYQYNRSGGVNLAGTLSGSTRYLHINSASNNGLYCYRIVSSAIGRCVCFTDMNIYASSTNGDSGFTSFSTENTDFSFAAENYNFNFLKKDYGVIAGGDPLPPEPESETIGQYYTYCGIDAYFSSGTAQSVLLNYTVSPNEYMRLHPSEYDVMIDVSAVITTSGSDHPNIPLTYSKSYMQGLETYINSASNPNLQIWFDDLVSAQSNNSLADALKSWWGDVTNSDQQYYNPNGSVVSFGGASASGGTRSLGGYSLNPNLKISDIVFQCSIRVEYNQTDPRQVSGVYRWQQGLISGSRTQLENTISNNYNPPSEYSPQYPASLKDTQGNIVVGGTTVNPVVYNNLNAAVEYLFNIDTSDYLNIVGNTHSAIQETFNTLTDTSTNGAWAIIENSYALIPDEIWDWIKSAVAVILGGTIISWAMYFRIKKG